MHEVTPSEPFALFDGDDGSGLLLSGYCRAVFLDPEAQGGDALGAAFSALEEAGRAVESSSMDYRSRKIVYEYVLHPQISAKDLARGLGIRDDTVEKLIDKLEGEDDAK